MEQHSTRLGSSLSRQEESTAGSHRSGTRRGRDAAVAIAAAGLAFALWTTWFVARLREFYRVNGELRTGRTKRHYLLHVPAGHDPQRPAPLVVVIHGFMQSPAHQRRMSRWDRLADAEDFLTVYPLGTGVPPQWAAHEPVANSQRTGDQVAFIAELVEELSSRYLIDSDRIYASGMSNGGGLACALACELPEVFAAVGSVAGLYTYPVEGPATGRSVPLIAFHGELDRIVPIEGGVNRLGYPVAAVADWMAAYAARCRCTTRTAERLNTSVSRLTYSGGPDDAEVTYYIVSDGGHTWPGGVPLPEVVTGPTSPSVDATALTWEFFVNHPLRRTQPPADVLPEFVARGGSSVHRA